MAFRCVIVTPEQQAIDASVSQAILPAWDGLIGILTNRAPLLVKLGLGPLKIDVAGGPERVFFVDGGIAQMNDNQLTVLTNEATPAEEIDADAARAELAEATAFQPTDEKSRQDRTHRMDRARALQEVARPR